MERPRSATSTTLFALPKLPRMPHLFLRVAFGRVASLAIVTGVGPVEAAIAAPDLARDLALGVPERSHREKRPTQWMQ